MKDIADDVLLAELKRRFELNQKMMNEQSELVSQLERINRRLLESEKTQSAFLSNIRNEINNPLTAILGLSGDMIVTHNTDQLRRSASLIFTESFQLGLQMQNIFIAAELEAGQSQPYVMNVQIRNLVELTLENYRHLTVRKNLSVQLKSDLTSEDVFATDPEKIKVVLSNLMMNAVEYSCQDGKILVTVDRHEQDLFISVRDNGEGIPEDKIGRIFDRFVQLNSGSTKPHPGHGLGLSVVRSLVEFLNGHVDVSSQVGKGSNFVITIPESDASNSLGGLSADGNEFMFDSDDEIVA